MPVDYRILEGSSRGGRNYAALYDALLREQYMNVNSNFLAYAEDIHRDRMLGGSWMNLRPEDVGSAAALVDAPSKATLTRVPAVVVEELSLDDPRRKLAVDAEMLLGYQPLLRDTKAPGRLRRALAALEIEVLDQTSVDAYKVQMVQHYASHQKMRDPTWRIRPLRGYSQPVPEHVLAKAVEIKRVLPEVEFYVDQLAVDPFLIVSLAKLEDVWTNQTTRGLDPETAAYVEVWDEPKFEGAYGKRSRALRIRALKEKLCSYLNW